MAREVSQNRNGFRRLGRPRFLPGLAFHLVLPIFSSRSYALIDFLIFGPKRCEPSYQTLLKVQNSDSKKTRIKPARGTLMHENSV